MPVCRLIIDGPQGGAWNMAADETLLNRAAGEPSWSLRFYRWSEPTLSLGYFQTCQSRSAHSESRACAVTRRPSGGGAILHDQELTYCLVAPANHPLARDAHGLYRAVHGALIEALAEVDIVAHMHEQAEAASADRVGGEPFLCFRRRSPGDLLIGKDKIGGSAQRRRGGAVLQHGSFLLRRSIAAPELPGVEDLHRLHLTWEAWQTLALSQLAKRLSLELQPRDLSEEERREVAALAHEKYASPTWNERR